MADHTPLTVQSPGGTVRGGIVVVQEAFGVNDHIEDVCRRFAAEGWLVVASHLFHRSGDPKLGYTDLSEVMPHMQAVTKDGVLQDMDAAAAHLASAGIPAAPRGAVGLCMRGPGNLVAA